MVKRSLPTRITGLILFIFVCFITAWAGAQVSPGVAPMDWYMSIEKPSWNPPGWVFGPVWSTLYLLMAVAAWRVWVRYGFRGAAAGLSFFFIQLVLNGLWSQIFFGMQLIGWAFVELLFLLAAIITTTFLFYKKDRIAAWLLYPYIAWVSFAGYLNFTIWTLNQA